MSQPPNADRERLPFEPAQNRKKGKPSGTPHTPPTKGQDGPVKSGRADKPNQSDKPKKPGKQEQSGKEDGQKPVTRAEMAVPEVVSRRMVRRMAFFCGIPSAVGMSTFFVSYEIVINGWFKLPTAAVLLVSLGFFGLGVLGLTYGVLSASWDEDRLGGWLGWGEFTTNLGRMTEAWRSSRQKS